MVLCSFIIDLNLWWSWVWYFNRFPVLNLQNQSPDSKCRESRYRIVRKLFEALFIFYFIFLCIVVWSSRICLCYYYQKQKKWRWDKPFWMNSWNYCALRIEWRIQRNEGIFVLLSNKYYNFSALQWIGIEMRSFFNEKCYLDMISLEYIFYNSIMNAIILKFEFSHVPHPTVRGLRSLSHR